MRGNNPNGTHYTEHIRTLVVGPFQRRRQAVNALTVDTLNKGNILNDLTRIIEEQSEILYEPTPEADELEKYKAMIEDASIIQQVAIRTALGILGPDGLLDNKQPFVKLVDRSGMLERLGQWGDHVLTMEQRARETAEQFRKKHVQKTIKHIDIFGLGGSGAPHDIAADIISNWRKSSIRIKVIHADTPNPDYIDENTLTIFCSFSGTTEETINCYETVQHKTDMRVVLAKEAEPGKSSERGKKSLRQMAERDEIPFIKLPADKNHPAYVMQPRESVCLQLTAMLTFLASIGLEPGSGGSLTPEDLALEKEIIPLIKKWRRRFGPEVPYKDNPAKRLAFFLLYGIDYKGEEHDLWRKRFPKIEADINNWGIAHEVRTQLHERSKRNAGCYAVPESFHNQEESKRAGVESSHCGLDNDPFVYYFIRSLDEEPRIRLRLDRTIERVLKGKGYYAELNFEGENPLQRALCAVYFNAHMTTYLALLNGFDPLPVPTMSWLKNVMSEFPRNGEEEKKARIIHRPLLVLNTP